MMVFFRWYLKVFKENFTDVNGRISRKDFWKFKLGYLIFVGLFFIILYLVNLIGRSPLSGILGLIGILAKICIFLIFISDFFSTIRRLHDTGTTGWFHLIRLIPIVGDLLFLIKLLDKGDILANKWGIDPEDENFQFCKSLLKEYRKKTDE